MVALVIFNKKQYLKCFNRIKVGDDIDLCFIPAYRLDHKESFLSLKEYEKGVKFFTRTMRVIELDHTVPGIRPVVEFNNKFNCGLLWEIKSGSYHYLINAYDFVIIKIHFNSLTKLKQRNI